MFVPRFLRVDDMTPTTLSESEIRPVVRVAMEWYFADKQSEYGEDLITASEATEITLKEHYLVLVNGDYLLGYSLGSEWYAKRPSLTEEYLIRVGNGGTTLEGVFDVFRVMAKLHGAREAYVCPGSKALKRLYARHGAEESISNMRVT